MASKPIPEFSLGEASIFYPASKILNSNMPLSNTLFLKMVCTQFGSLRTGVILSKNLNPYDVYASGGTELARIFVPAPKQIISNTNIIYLDDTTTLGTLANLGSSIGSIALQILTLGISNIAVSESGVKRVDQKETLFDGAEKRSYTLNYTLAATNETDALQIAKMINILQSLALPVKTTNGVSEISGNPPYWRFGIGQDLTGKIDPSWLGQTKICVLKSVSVNTSAGGSPYAINHPDGIKPLIVSFSLTFLEVQAAYRETNSFNIISRSESFTQ